MKTKTILILISMFFIHQIYGYEIRDELNDSSNVTKTQLSIYSSFLLSLNISGAHGNHGLILGQPNDVTVEGIEIQQNWGIGVNTKFYLFNNFNLQLELLYSNSVFPDQEVNLDGYTIWQPKSNLNFFTISVGPGFRYSNDGIFQSLNPYAFISLSTLLGYADNVNFSPSYASGGYSFVSGIGYNLDLGVQYHINRFIIGLDYRFEYQNSKIYYFRSFTQGLYFNKSSSSILLGLGYML